MTQAPFWYDSAPLESDWPAPTPRWRRFVPLLVVLGVVAVIIALVAALGGFADRTNSRILLVNPATELESGQLRTSFTRAEAAASYSGGWQITVFGTCQNTSDRPTHISSSKGFSLYVPVIDTYADPSLLHFHENSLYLNPGLAPTPCTILFDVPTAGALPDHIMVGA